MVQGLSRDLAAHIAHDTQLMDADGLKPEAVRTLFSQLMLVNPSVEVYLLDIDGRVVGNAAPEGHMLRDQVDLTPIRRFLSGAMLPILGDDPRSVDGRKVFSAAPLKVGGQQAGFLYVVLLGEAHDVYDAKDATGMALKIALWSIGQVVSAGQTVFTLATDGEREVLISLPEQGFGRFKIGQPVSVELWSQPDQRFSGRIRELSPAADPKSRTFAARVAFIGGKVPAELGQSARVFIQADGVVPLSVPLSALSAENGASYVWRVQPDNSITRVPVRIGAFGEKSVPVLEGLAPTDWVIAAGVHVLHEGQQVRPVDRSNRVVNLAARPSRTGTDFSPKAPMRTGTRVMELSGCTRQT